MIFGSTRLGGKGNWDLWQTTRSAIGQEWSDPVNLDTINTRGGEGTPSLSKDGLTLYFSSGCCGSVRPGSRDSDIWYSARETINSQWSPPVRMEEVSAVGLDAYPSISEDGLTLYWMSHRTSSYGIEDIYVSTRESVTGRFGKPLNLGPVINTPNADFSPFISADGTLYLTSNVIRGVAPWWLWQAAPRVATLGDFNADDVLNVADLDILTDAIFSTRNVVGTDLNADHVFDYSDVRQWVANIQRTWIGDANLDGEFNSSDLTAVFQAGQYEDSRRTNSTWATGDWNGDLEFSSTDLVVAFQDAGYEAGPRNVAAVPEPATNGIVVLGLLSLSGWRIPHTRRRESQSSQGDIQLC
jgi:hypothetical protein